MSRNIPVYFWFPVVGCTAGGTFFMNVAPVANQFMELFGVGYAGLSLFISSLYWVHSICQMPGGIAVDRLGVTRALLLCLAVMAATNIIPFIAPENFALAVAMKLILGLVTGAFFLVMVKIIKILTPPIYIARMQGMHGAAFCLGSLIPYLYLPPAGVYGWAASYLSSVLFCILIGLCMLFLPLDRLRETCGKATLSQTMRAVKTISTSEFFWLLGCCHGFFFGTINTLGNWLPSILMDLKTGSTLEDWAIATGGMLLVGTLGRIFGAEVIGKLTRWELITRVLLITGLSYWVLALCSNPVLYFCLCLVLALLCGLTFASVFTLLIDISEPSYVSASMGFVNMLANGVNILLVLLWGTLREYTGGFSYGLCISGAFALLVWFWARKQNLEKNLPQAPA